MLPTLELNPGLADPGLPARSPANLKLPPIPILLACPAVIALAPAPNNPAPTPSWLALLAPIPEPVGFGGSTDEGDEVTGIGLGGERLLRSVLALRWREMPLVDEFGCE